jgi:hypothetical protein
VSNLALKLYYQKKVRVCLDVLDELERLQREPGAQGVVKQNAEEAQLEWEREFTRAHAEYDGIREGLSTLPLPPQEMRDRLASLSDAVEGQINANKAANLAMDAAARLLDMVAEFKKLD